MSSQNALSSCVEAGLLELSSRLDDYTLKYLLGQGGCGSVYLAERLLESVRAQVALKVVNREHAAINHNFVSLAAEKKLMERFHTDDKPGFFTHLIETFEDQHNTYFVIVSTGTLFFSFDLELTLRQEYIPGMTLLDAINRGAMRTDKRRMQHILAQLVVAVERLHKMKWMHRDIKPENILLDADGNVVLTDFGQAYDFSGGDVVQGKSGTPGFSSPQASAGGQYTSKTDIYSLGAVFQTMAYKTVSLSCILFFAPCSLNSQTPEMETVVGGNYYITTLLTKVRANAVLLTTNVLICAIDARTGRRQTDHDRGDQEGHVLSRCVRTSFIVGCYQYTDVGLQ